MVIICYFWIKKSEMLILNTCKCICTVILKLFLQQPLFPLHLFLFKHFSLAFQHFPFGFAPYWVTWPYELCTWPSWQLITYSWSHYEWENTKETALFLIDLITKLKACWAYFINHKNSQPASDASPSFATRASNKLNRSLTPRQINRRRVVVVVVVVDVVVAIVV